MPLVSPELQDWRIRGVHYSRARWRELTPATAFSEVTTTAVLGGDDVLYTVRVRVLCSACSEPKTTMMLW